MKIILWIGNEPNQKALANKIHDLFPLSCIVTETKKHYQKITIRNLIEKVIEKIFLPSIAKSWWGMKSYYDNSFQKFPDVAILNVENINSDEAFEFSKNINADLILVSGTRMIREKMLTLNPTIGILNLHTGLSPYVKGGPNCTNWSIATNQFYLVGNTIMWIDAGIDTGNILTTEFTEISGEENLLQLHINVMEHAHSLCIKSIKLIQEGIKTSVPQAEIAVGKTYYTKDWTLKRKIGLITNFKKIKYFVKSKQLFENRKKIITIENNK